MAIRSGRFKGPAGTAIELMRGKGGLFRVFNAGKEPFDIRPQSGAGADITLGKECSVDVEVTNRCRILGSGTKPVKGMYDYVGSLAAPPRFRTSRAIRSGRFTGDASTVKIVQGADDEIYRIMNSGGSEITLQPTGVVLKPKFSIDIVTKSDISVDGINIECIYDRLDGEQQVRSGRFNVSDVTNMYPLRIIDLSNGNRTGWYRLYNSGEHKIVVLKGDGTGSPPSPISPSVEVEKECSIDFLAPTVDIYVQPDDPAKPIKGIYEYLGN